jgi:hypothetical protein
MGLKHIYRVAAFCHFWFVLSRFTLALLFHQCLVFSFHLDLITMHGQIYFTTWESSGSLGCHSSTQVILPGLVWRLHLLYVLVFGLAVHQSSLFRQLFWSYLNWQIHSIYQEWIILGWYGNSSSFGIMDWNTQTDVLIGSNYLSGNPFSVQLDSIEIGLDSHHFRFRFRRHQSDFRCDCSESK